MALFLGSIAYGQTITLNSKGDTLYCLTEGQIKYLSKQAQAANKLTILLNVSEGQRMYLDSAHTADSTQIKALNGRITVKEQEKGLCEHEKTGLVAELKESGKEVRRQKIYKWLAVGIGSAAIIAETYYFVFKQK